MHLQPSSKWRLVTRLLGLPPVIRPASVPHGPLHLLIDSTGLQVYGAGQWLEAKHGIKSRRKWRKLHLVVDASDGMIVAQTLTDQDVADPSQVVPLLDQIDGRIARVTADGAYDGAPTYATIAAQGDDIEVVIPPRSTAVPSGEQGPLAQRDRHLNPCLAPTKINPLLSASCTISGARVALHSRHIGFRP